MKRNDLTAVLEVVFAAAAVCCALLLALAAAALLLPVGAVALMLVGGYLLAWAMWRQIVPAGHAARNWRAVTGALLSVWESLVEFDRRSHQDFNRLVHCGWGAFCEDRPTPRLAFAGGEDLGDLSSGRAAALACAADGPAEHPAEDAHHAGAVRDLLEQLAEGWTMTHTVAAVNAAGDLHVSDVRVEEDVRLDREHDDGHGAAQIPGGSDLADALRLEFYPDDAFTVEDLPVVAVLPTAMHAGNADRADYSGPDALPATDEDVGALAWSILPDDRPEDLPPATSTPAAEPAAAPQTAHGSFAADAPMGFLAPKPAARRKPVPKTVAMPAANRATVTTGANAEALTERALALLAEGKSQRETARLLNVPDSTLRARLGRHKRGRQADAA